MILIPTDSSLVYFTQTTTLDGADYLLEFRFNARESLYYLRISIPDGTVQAQGIKLVANYPLLQNYNNANLPPGELVVIAYGSNDAPPTLGELGEGLRCTLWYSTFAEVQALGVEGWRNPLPTENLGG